VCKLVCILVCKLVCILVCKLVCKVFSAIRELVDIVKKTLELGARGVE
jgi:hypothetical protein